MLNLTRLHLGIAHESQFQGRGISDQSASLGAIERRIQCDRRFQSQDHRTHEGDCRFPHHVGHRSPIAGPEAVYVCQREQDRNSNRRRPRAWRTLTRRHQPGLRLLCEFRSQMAEWTAGYRSSLHSRRRHQPLQTCADSFGPGIADQPISTQLQIRGCNDSVAFAGMVESAAFADELGRDVIKSRILELSAYTKRCVMEAWGTDALFSPKPNSLDLCSGMISFVPSRNPAAGLDLKFMNEVVNALWSQSRIYVRSIPFPSPLQSGKDHYAIRVSTNIFNSFYEIDRLINETCRIANASAIAI
jgi:hypothetical protein